MRIAVLCPANIALRRFMPALLKSSSFEYVGVGIASSDDWQPGDSDANQASLVQTQRAMAEDFVRSYGGNVFEGYQTLLDDSSVEAVYIPLPPALHYPWAKKALLRGKHVLLEKPFTTSLKHSQELVALAQERHLALHENYMFAFHSQIQWAKSYVESGKLGDIRLIRVDFGFPFRGATDFRYDSKLGGGALLDAGGYTLKLGSMFLGQNVRVTTAQLNSKKGLSVDVYGSASMIDDAGAVAQLSWGMDNDYRCNLDVWGSKATLTSGRILTAPADFCPTMNISANGETSSIQLKSDDSFFNSIEHFANCIADPTRAEEQYVSILTQAKLVDSVVRMQTSK